jgi:phage gp46-like protein
VGTTYTVGPSGRDYTTIQAAIQACRTTATSRADMDRIVVDGGTYTEALDTQKVTDGYWGVVCVIEAADPDNKPIIASTGATTAINCGTYRSFSVAAGELTLRNLVFSGWTNASLGVIRQLNDGIVIDGCEFVGNTGRACIVNLGSFANRWSKFINCKVRTSGSTGSGSAGIVLTYGSLTEVYNNDVVCPTNVQFHSGDALLVAHNSVSGTWNTGGNCKVIAGSITTVRGNLIKNLGTGGSHAIDAGSGTYVENRAFGTFTTRFAGTNGGENYNEDPLFADAAGGDLTLELTSPAIRSLSRNATVLLDYEGDSRSDPTDAGAYEMVLDVTAPTITGWTRTSKTTVVLTFSEDLDETSAETAGNYTTSPMRSVTATLTDTNEVTLTLSPAVDSMVLTVAGVEDLAGNALASWSRELGWYDSETSGAVMYAVTSTGGSVDYLPGWDPMPSGVGSEATLERLVFVSLFSDARIADDETPPDGTRDRRGWWGDSYSERPDNTGSRLWYLMGRAGTTAREIEDAVRAALSWMITDRLCSTIAVVATIEGQRAGVVIDMGLTTGDRKQLAYPDLWSAYAP